MNFNKVISRVALAVLIGMIGYKLLFQPKLKTQTFIFQETQQAEIVQTIKEFTEQSTQVSKPKIEYNGGLVFVTIKYR